MSSECRTRSMGLGLVHRFLVLELARKGKKTIWARLDRTRVKPVGPLKVRVAGRLKFLIAAGTTPSNDIVRQHYHI